MPIVSTGGDGSCGSTAFISSSVPGGRQHALRGFMHMRIQHTIQPTTASFFCRKPHPKVIGMLSAKGGQGASCAKASSHRERGL
jgi:hypothetical protein